MLVITGAGISATYRVLVTTETKQEVEATAAGESPELSGQPRMAPTLLGAKANWDTFLFSCTATVPTMRWYDWSVPDSYVA